MTTEHPSQTQLIAYGARTLNPDELLAVDRHLATCDACRDRLAGMLPKMTARPYDLSNDEEPFHLDYDQHLVPYVDGVADDIDREIIESHIALCPRCAEEVGDLQEFRQQSSQPARQTDRGVKTWVGWRDQRPQTWRRPLAAGLALVFSILGITAAVSFWDRSRTPQPKHVGSVPSPENDPKTVNSPASSPGQVATQPSPDRPDLQGEEPLITLYDAGGKILYYGNGDSKGLDALPPDLRATVENVLVTRRFGRSPALGNLYESNGRLRGGSEGQDTIVQLSPVGVILETDRPVFSWRALEGASEYVVT
ncbi:MAG TPA: zf-HC2 domain-containing protein, partial [Pyrinomonadaceae bacterium]|nr:zf-HC2 domain-containing protein [Pyrinomonadaceae bacterium]